MIPINDLTRGIAQSKKATETIVRVLKSGYWVHGPEHAAFEQEFAEFLKVGHVLGVASGSDALEIALKAVGCGLGSKVISVANAGGYTPIAVAAIGGEIIYCDVNSENLVMDPEALNPLLSNNIDAVVVTHLYGNVAPVTLIKEMCDQFGIPVIEDCAQAVGATERGFRVGTIGDIGTFSFYPTKNLGAIGDGGALATNDPEIAKRIAQLRQYGWTSKYKIDVPGGMNSRLDEIQAAVLRIGLIDLDIANEKRLRIVERYAQAVDDSGLKMVTSFSTGNVAHLAVLEIPEHLGRDKFRDHMKEYGVQTEIHYPILDSDQKGLNAAYFLTELRNSRDASARIVTIPLFPSLTEDEVLQISTALKNFV